MNTDKSTGLGNPYSSPKKEKMFKKAKKKRAKAALKK